MVIIEKKNKFLPVINAKLKKNHLEIVYIFVRIYVFSRNFTDIYFFLL